MIKLLRRGGKHVTMIESQVARVRPYHRDANSGVGYFEPVLYNVQFH
jgi:hypothetical protein